MAINKVVYDGDTLVDLTSDTVTPETLAEGMTAHAASGARIVGTMPVDVVRYGEQTLTEGQQAQARENIGALGESDIEGKLNTSGDGSNVTAAFSTASSRANIGTGEKLSVIFGKIAKWFADLKTVAFTGSYNDLSNKPTIPSAYTHPSSHPASMITGLATVATSGSYNDLSNKPTIPAAVTVDSALSSSSTNPVQNKVINSALAGKQNKITGTAGQVVGFDASGNPVAQAAPSGGGGGTTFILSATDPGGLAEGDYWCKVLTELEAPEEMLEPKIALLNITGTGNTTYCYATINGTKRYGAASNIEVEPGSVITFGVYGRSTTYPGWVKIDGATALNVTNQSTQTYNWTVPDKTKTISISMSYTSTSTQRRGQITVTTTK